MLNLHALANAAISGIHPNVTATLYRSTGMALGSSGESRPEYDTAGIEVSAQMQSEGTQALYQSDRVGMEEVSRKFYLRSSADLETRVAGIVRPLSRAGDFLRLDNGAWWLVDAVIEDFTRSGWVSVRATLQVEPPPFAPEAS